MTVLCEHGATEISLPFKINVQTAFVQSILASIILLPLLISLLLTLLDFSPASKIHALFFSVSHELKQILSQAVTRAGDLTLLQSVQSSCNSHHVTFKNRLLLLSMYYVGCLPSMPLITQGCGKKWVMLWFYSIRHRISMITVALVFKNPLNLANQIKF